MGRPQEIFIDTEAIFAGICEAWAEQFTGAESWLAEAAAAVKANPKNFYRRSEHLAAQQCLNHLALYGIRCDIERFLGHAPTPTERLRVQKVIRDLEAAGRIVRTGRDILPIDQEEETNGE